MKDFYESFKKSRWFPLVMGILSVVLGFLCLINPQMKMESIALYIAFIVLVYGVLQLLSGLMTKDNGKLRAMNLIVGVIAVILAIVVFANKALVGKYLPTVVGFYMIISAIGTLLNSLSLMKNGIKNWWASALPAAVVLVLGLVILLNPGFAGATFGIITGITLLVSGLSHLINFIQFKK